MSFFKSEIVQGDLQDIFDTYKMIAQMSAELPNMNTRERVSHINETLGLVEKQKLFYTRLVLASKECEEAADMKDRIDKLTSSFGYANLTECIEAMSLILHEALKKELESDK